MLFWFGWPLDLAAQVETRIQINRTDSGRTEKRSLGGTYTMRVEGAPEGLRVRHENFDLQPMGRETFRSSPGDALLNLGQDKNLPLAILRPDLLVNAQGDVARVLGGEGVRSDWNRILDAAEGLPSAQRASLADLFANGWLDVRATDDWNSMVAIWSGAEFEIGNPYEFDEPDGYQLGVLGKLPARGIFRARRFLPCGTPHGSIACVELELRMEVHREAATRAFARWYRDTAHTLLPGSLGPATLEKTIDFFDYREYVVLVTNPAGLIPYRLSMRRETSLGIRTAAGKVETLSEAELVETSFRYDRPL